MLAVMQEDCAYLWRLEELAQHTGPLRTALAHRVRETPGDTPLNHLRTPPMQRAMQLLSETEQWLKAVAAAVDYPNAFGFSKVFKRTLCMCPCAFRSTTPPSDSYPGAYAMAEEAAS